MASDATAVQGLSEREAADRRARGQGNEAAPSTSRTYREILRDNAFTFVNVVLFSIVLLLLALGLFGDALVTAGLVLFNVVAGVVQEGRAKRKLDQIALLVRPVATVVRDGRERAVDPREVVLGDLLVARPGDQIVADGRLADGRVDVDESLLTGESDLVPKGPGDPVYSGSFCVAGEARYRAEQVGTASLANQLVAGARAFRTVKTPLQRAVDLILRVALVVALLVGVQVASSLWRSEGAFQLRESVRAAAVIVALVPQGLAFMVTVSYAMGAVRMAGKGALIQRANAVESLSHVNVLCLDKTGTLTTNRIRFHALHPLGLAEPELRARLGDFAATVAGGNRTAAAVQAALGGTRRRATAEVPFSSERKWSAASFDGDGLHGTYVLGAPEVLLSALADGREQVEGAAAELARQGLRVLLLAFRPEVLPLTDGDGRPALPQGLTPAGLASLSEELRPEAAETLARFAEAGIQVKVISGDSPETVAALARRAGLAEVHVASGLDLADLDAGAFEAAARESNVFGRITPQQKERLVRALRAGGAYVAMIGDGVNDVLALKQANLGIAMQSGSQATRGVADMVLLGDSFGALPAAFREGQRIFRGMRDILSLFLVRTLYVTLLIGGTALAGAAFPVTPKQNSVLALLTVGIPTLALAAWAKPAPPARGMAFQVARFVVPGAVLVTAVALPLYLAYLWLTDDVALARTVLTITAVLCGLLLILFLEPPGASWHPRDVLRGDLRPAALTAAMLALFVLLLSVRDLREFFELVPLAPYHYAVILAAVALWARALLWTWRLHLFERFLGMEPR
ncbi:MAG TPA: HAD-IC family P-type ATPase [Dehalococcoidia bacterium]